MPGSFIESRRVNDLRIKIIFVFAVTVFNIMQLTAGQQHIISTNENMLVNAVAGIYLKKGEAEDIAKLMQRSNGAIESRLKKIGLIGGN